MWNPNYAGTAMNVYQALTFLGEKVDFITYRQLAQGEGLKYTAIIAPAVTHLEAAYPALAQFAATPGRKLLLVGEGCLRSDEYERARDIAGLPCASLAAGGPRELAEALKGNLGLDWPVRVVDADTGQPMWGVGWRWARQGDRWLVNLCNYLRKPVKVRVEGPTGAQANLFTDTPVAGALELEGMEPALLSIGG
jgi:hypothetical protein